MALAPSHPAMLRATDPDAWPDLMVRAQAGDAGAYRLLLNGVLPYLRQVAGRSLRQSADVEDAVQDILLTLHAVRHTYDPERPFRPWLLGIARHRIIDRLRIRTRLAAREMPLDAEIAAADVPADGGIDARALHAGIATLPQGQRQAITLLKMQELSLREASVASGQSVAALKVSAHRGLKALRRLFGQQDEQS